MSVDFLSKLILDYEKGNAPERATMVPRRAWQSPYMRPKTCPNLTPTLSCCPLLEKPTRSIYGPLG